MDIVYIIPADREEYLYLLNQKKIKKMRVRHSVGGEQDWLNEVYLWEKFDIGFEFNAMILTMQVFIREKAGFVQKGWGVCACLSPLFRPFL